MCFEIRKAELRDLGDALKLDKMSFGPDAWTVMDYMGVFSMRDVKKFTAVSGGEFAGFAASQYDRKEEAVCLMTIAVSPKHRRKGIGAALLKAAETAFGPNRIYLYVDAENTDAIRLYRHAGYEAAGMIPSYYMNGNDALVMEKQSE